MEAALIILTGAYLALVIFFWIGWKRQGQTAGAPKRLPNISAIVPFRDEGGNLEACAPASRIGTYPENRCEVVYVDDHSTDQGPETVVDLIHAFPSVPIQLHHLTTETGKKAALTKGIRHSRGEIIATLDADTYTTDRWWHCVGRHFDSPDVQLLILPVTYDEPTGLFQKLAALEFTSLVATGMASAKMGFPLMANGANLAFRRSAWLEVNGYQSHAHLPSGDDLFLMFAIDRMAPGSVRVVHDADALAFTAPPENVREFIRQRLRWAGKTPAYKSAWPVGVGLVVLGWNLILLTNLVLAIWNPSLWTMAAWCFGGKLVADTLFLASVTPFFQQRALLWLTPLLAAVYPFYTVGIGLASLFIRPRWKGRKLDF